MRALVAKSMPDASAVHVLGSGKVARRIKRKKVAKAFRPRRVPKPKKPEAPTLFDLSPEGDVVNIQRAMTRDSKKRAQVSQWRKNAFGERS